MFTLGRIAVLKFLENSGIEGKYSYLKLGRALKQWKYYKTGEKIRFNVIVLKKRNDNV